MTQFKIRYLVFIIIILSAVCFFMWQQKYKSSIPYVLINDTKINIEIADTSEERVQGLSDRDELCEQCGMLFIFPDSKERTFVMRRMHFPLDIIWISNDVIVKIDKNLPPEGINPIERYSSDIPVNYVLEVNAGFTSKFKISEDDKVRIK